MDYYQTIISGVMLFADSSWYIVPTWFLFIALSFGGVFVMAILVGILVLAGVNIPIIAYTVAAIFASISFVLAAVFALILVFAPLTLSVAGLFLLIPWIMWMSLPNTDKHK